MPVVWTFAAARGVWHTNDYLAEFDPRSAMHIAACLRADGNSLVNFPARGRPVPGTNMLELVTSYPYIIRYRIEGEDEVILRIRHSARRPATP